MDQSSSSSFVAAGIKRKNEGEQQERRVVVGEMDFFETEMRKEKRDRKDAGAGAGDLGIANKGDDDLTIDVRDPVDRSFLAFKSLLYSRTCFDRSHAPMLADGAARRGAAPEEQRQRGVHRRRRRLLQRRGPQGGGQGRGIYIHLYIFRSNLHARMYYNCSRPLDGKPMLEIV